MMMMLMSVLLVSFILVIGDLFLGRLFVGVISIIKYYRLVLIFVRFWQMFRVFRITDWISCM